MLYIYLAVLVFVGCIMSYTGGWHQGMGVALIGVTIGIAVVDRAAR